jgi:hypothetical protein
LFLQPFDYLRACIDQISGGPHPYASLAILSLTLTLTAIVYVPAHELLHAFGCIASGGTVTSLEIQPIYGGAVLAEVFDFVVADSEYAGRLSGFDTHGSDIVYLVTVAMPYLLTVLIGVPALRLCTMRSRPLLFGAATLLSFAPFYSVPGDYYEMGSILATRAATWFLPGTGDGLAYKSVRSDDVFALIGDVLTKPAESGLAGENDVAIAFGLIALSLVVAVLLAFGTFFLGGIVAQLGGVARPSPS